MENYCVENGLLVSVPLFDDHSYATNWMAVISSDPMTRARFSRRFLQNEGSGFFYHVSDLKPGDAVEFGSNRYRFITKSGTKGTLRWAKRWYGVVLAVTDTGLSLEKCPTWRHGLKRTLELQPTEIVLFSGTYVPD